MIVGEINRLAYPTDGTTTGFPFTTTVLKKSDVTVLLQNSTTGALEGTLTEGTNYTVEGVVDTVGRYLNGITIRTSIVYPAGYNIIIYQNPAISQLVDLRDNGLLPVESQIELPLDRLTVIAQRLKNLITRTLRQPDADSADIAELPIKSTRASKFFAFDSNGNPIAAAGTSANLTPVSAFVNTLLDDADAATARATFGFPAILAKGDLIAGTGVDTLGRVPNNNVPGLALMLAPEISTNLQFGFRDQFNGFPNGDMDVWQDGNAFVNVANGAYTADMWRWNFVGGGTINVNKSSDIPAFVLNNFLYPASLEIDVTGADASIAAADHYIMITHLEGYDWSYFAQRDFTIIFAVKSPKTGTHSLSVANSNADRSCIGTYEVLAANTWELKSVTIPASPTAGTWDYINGLGLQVRFVLAAGADYHNTALTWYNGNYLSTAAQPNCMDSTSNFFRLAGVRIVPGTLRFPQRFEPFATKLARCRRYYQKSRVYGEKITDASGTNKGEHRIVSSVGASVVTRIEVRLPVSMRTTPTGLTWNPSGGNAHVRNQTDGADCSATSVENITSESMTIVTTTSAGTAAGEQLGVHWSADARF